MRSMLLQRTNSALSELGNGRSMEEQPFVGERIMRKSIILAVFISAALAGNAFAQPATNGPSGSGPESKTSPAATGSAENPEAGKMKSGSAMKTTKHSKKKTNTNM
jgi:hypothetical protein